MCQTIYESQLIVCAEFPHRGNYPLISSLGYEPFCDVIRNLFGNDVSTQDLKALFRKIALNPDAKVDWSEVSLICSQRSREVFVK